MYGSQLYRQMPAFTQNVYKFNQISSKFLGHMKQNSGLVLVHMHADPIYPTNFTCPYLLLADNYWGGLLIPEITVILSTHFTTTKAYIYVFTHKRSKHKNKKPS